MEMIMRRDYSGDQDIGLNAEGGTFFLAAQSSDTEEDLAMIGNIRMAINKLNDFGDAGRMRSDAISNGKAIIRNWQAPTDDQISKIIANMKKQLMA